MPATANDINGLAMEYYRSRLNANTGATAPTYTAPAVKPVGTDRSGTATTTSGGLTVAANANRTSLKGQNVSIVSIGYNEFGGTAVIGNPGTFVVLPNTFFEINTRGAVNFVAASATAAVTMTES